MIRQTKYNDILAIMKRMQSEPDFWQASWGQDVIKRGIKSADGLSFEWGESGQILGFICAHDLGFRAYLSELIVHNSAKKGGIGKLMVKHIEYELGARGCNILIVEIWKNAEKFSKSLGWSEPDVLLMRKTSIQ